MSGILEKLQAQMEDMNKSMAILLERSGMSIKASEKASDKPASEKALEAAATGRRGRGAAAEEKPAEEKPAARGRGRAAAEPKAKKMTAAEFEKAVEDAFQVEEIPALQNIEPELSQKDFDNIYEDFGTGLKPILEHLGATAVKDVKKDEDRLFVLKYFELATQAAVDDNPMPTVEDVEDAINGTGEAAEEEKPARRGRR